VYTNPADHLLDVITPVKNGSIGIDHETPSSEKQLTIDAAIFAAQPTIDIDLNMGCDKRDVQMNNILLHPKWNKQVQILLRRNFQEQRRKFQTIFVSFVQSVIMAGLMGSVFFQIGNSQKTIFRRESFLFSCVVNQSLFGALMIVNSFPAERTLTLRERASGTYYASAYFTAKILTDTLVQLPVPIVFVSLFE
jgi:ATP-binding cassette subfamily G (WHITE) protein 2